VIHAGEGDHVAFRLKADEPVGKGFRRIVRGQIDKALEGLGQRGEAEGEGEDVVHDARKRFKKVRAVLRLVSGGMGRKAYHREDTRYRDAGRPLSEVRDAAVLVETFDQLVGPISEPERPPGLAAVRDALMERKREAGRRVFDDDKVLEDLMDSVSKGLRRLKRLDLDEGGWPLLADGLKRVYRLGRGALADAAEQPTDERLHEWRKRVKDLWHALEVLQPLRPHELDARAEQAHRLADQLGDDHDLAVLREVLSESARDPRHAGVATLLPVIDRRRAELQRAAFELGELVYDERPKDFVARLGTYWRTWRSEAEAAQLH
jgi:CHAD domain-containing protein